jgi:hypothetical protein
MAHAYTPGLRISKRTLLQKRRRLPIKGTTFVEKGQQVRAEDIVASAKLPGKVHTVNVINVLGIMPEEIRRYMVKKEGDEIKKSEPLAMTRPIIKWFRTVVRSPIDGIVESISEITGQVLLREPPEELKLTAYIDGTVSEIVNGEGVVIETVGAYIQGIFGLGGEQVGTLCMLAQNPDQILKADMIEEKHKDKIIVGGSYAGSDVWQRALEVGVKGIVIGGIEAYDVKILLGYELGVAITGMEDIGFTLITTEGFGRMPMAKRSFELLSSLDGMKASICGATQIRAGVIRPEVIVPEKISTSLHETGGAWERGALAVGDIIRIIREPYFGKIGRVKSLPNELQIIETESKVRVLEVEFPDGQVAIIPRANVEILEE